MIAWIIANAATLLIGTLLLIFIVFTMRYTIKKAKKSQCIGCAGCNMNKCDNKEYFVSCNSLASDKKRKNI
jgi:hypothetical protein